MNDKINQLCSDCFLQFVEMRAGDHVGFMFTILIGQPRILANRIHSVYRNIRSGMKPSTALRLPCWGAEPRMTIQSVKIIHGYNITNTVYMSQLF